MRIWTVIAALAALVAQPALAQDPGPDAPIQYDVRFDNAVHHEARITVTYRDLKPGPVTFRMSRSSPGRYAIHEFAKNVYSVVATDGAGRALPIARTDPYSWTVSGHGGTVSVSYTLYADHGDGTYSQVDTSHAHLNMPATFMWVDGYADRPIRVRFTPFDKSWKVATQLPPAGEANTFWAPNFQYFMDSPTELSDFMLREWKVGEKTYRIAIHHQGSAAEADRFAEMAKNVVNAHIAIWGAPAPYDYGTYTFIADYVPWIDGDGMEHRNSTIIAMPRGLAQANYAQLGTLSHEFFHSWNVERLRPAELEPFDFTRANPTPSLWFAEGFTQYYGPLAVLRAKESSLDAFVAQLGGTLNYILNNPGRKFGSPQEMSLRAPFVDAATAIDPVNPNIFTSYYPYGAVVALALDLELRQRFPGKSLDDYMRLLWKTHGAPEKPYAPQDLETALAALTGDAKFAKDFFARSVTGHDLPDFEPLLAQAGLKLRRRSPGGAYAGGVGFEGGKPVLSATPEFESPLYAAGLDSGDRIVSLDGTTLSSSGDWYRAVGAHKPGETVEIAFVRRDGSEAKAQITFVADPTLEIVRYEKAGLTLSPAQRAFRKAWLGTEG